MRFGPVFGDSACAIFARSLARRARASCASAIRSCVVPGLSCAACDAESESWSEFQSESGSGSEFGPFTGKNGSGPRASSGKKKKGKENSGTTPRGKKTHSCVSLK